jgi:hypothetical protein
MSTFQKALMEEAKAILKMRNAANHKKKASTKEGVGRAYHLHAANMRKKLALGYLKTANALLKQALVENYSKMIDRPGNWAKKLENLEASYRRQIDAHTRNKFQTIGSKALRIIGRWREDQNFRNTTRQTNNILKKTENVLKIGRNAIAETQGVLKTPSRNTNRALRWYNSRTPSRNTSNNGLSESSSNTTNNSRTSPSRNNKTLFQKALEAETRALPLFQIAKNHGTNKGRYFKNLGNKHMRQAQNLMKRALNENYTRSPGPNLESSYRKQIGNHMATTKELYGPNASSTIGNQILNNLKQRRTSYMKPSPFASNINRSLNRTPQPYSLLGKNIIQNNPLPQRKRHFMKALWNRVTFRKRNSPRRRH